MKEVYLSYSSKDKDIAKSVCTYLETHEILCWISDRDILIGEPFAREIIRGIKETNIFVLLYSQNSNISENILNEIDQAYRLGRTIIPFKIENAEMSDELKFYLSRRQWIDASNDYEKELPTLVLYCRDALGKDLLKNNSLNAIPQWADYVSDLQKNALHKLIDDMMEIDGGKFTMGATQEQLQDAYEWEKPVHKVVVSNFYITKHLITQELWSCIMPYNPSLNKDGKNLPVENVTWDECQDFIETINKMTGLSFKLPTEAQWEYAARGAGKRRGKKYSGGNNFETIGWCEINSGKHTHPVGMKNANELGLYDMSGNVWEWCSDWYDVYDSQTVKDPIGAVSGTRKVLRGGCANSAESSCRISYRIGRNLKYKEGFLGFRLVL